MRQAFAFAVAVACSQAPATASAKPVARTATVVLDKLADKGQLTGLMDKAAYDAFCATQ